MSECLKKKQINSENTHKNGEMMDTSHVQLKCLSL